MTVTPFDPLYPKTPCYTQTSWLYVSQNRSYCRSKFYIAAIGIFYLFSCDLDLDPITFIYDTKLTYIPWRYIRCANVNFPRLSKVIVWQRDRQTNTQINTTEIIYLAASEVVKKWHVFTSHGIVRLLPTDHIPAAITVVDASIMTGALKISLTIRICDKRNIEQRLLNSFLETAELDRRIWTCTFNDALWRWVYHVTWTTSLCVAMSLKCQFRAKSVSTQIHGITMPLKVDRDCKFSRKKCRLTIYTDGKDIITELSVVCCRRLLCRDVKP